MILGEVNAPCVGQRKSGDLDCGRQLRWGESGNDKSSMRERLRSEVASRVNWHSQVGNREAYVRVYVDSAPFDRKEAAGQSAKRSGAARCRCIDVGKNLEFI